MTLDLTGLDKTLVEALERIVAAARLGLVVEVTAEISGTIEGGQGDG